MSTTQEQTRQIIQSLIGKMGDAEKKLVNNYCREKHGQTMPLYVIQTPGDDPELQRFLVEIDKALETENWEFFEPGSNNPNNGQAVEYDAPQGDDAVEPEATPEPEANDDEECDEEFDQEDTQTEDYSSEEPAEPEPQPVAATPPQPTNPADPFAALVDAVAAKVLERIPKVEPTASGLDTEAVEAIIADKLHKRDVDNVLNYLLSQPEDAVREAFEKYDA